MTARLSLAYSIYANPENVREPLLTVQWLYANTKHEKSRQLALATVAAWMASVSVDNNVISNIPVLQKLDYPLFSIL